jgi:hypothetical protein
MPLPKRQAWMTHPILKLLSESDRQALEADVDRFPQEQIREPAPYRLRDAARLFDVRAGGSPPEDGVVARWFAAILPARADGRSAPRAFGGSSTLALGSSGGYSEIPL